MFSGAGMFLHVLGQAFLIMLGIFFAGIVLLILFALSLAFIALFSIRRGMVYHSLPKAIGAFFRLTGIAVGMLLVLALVLPLAVFVFKAAAWVVLTISATVILVGYLVGRTISRFIGWRLSRFGYYFRTFDNLRNKIITIVYA